MQGRAGQQRVVALGFLRTEKARIDSACPCLVVEVRVALKSRCIACKIQAPRLAPPRAEPGLLLKLRDQIVQIQDWRIVVAPRPPNGISLVIRHHFLNGTYPFRANSFAPGPGFAGSGRYARHPDPLAAGLHRLPGI